MESACRADNSLDCSLIDAVRNGNIRKAKSLIKRGASVECVNENTRGSALYHACLNENEAMVKMLLKYNACPNQRSGDGSTAVHAACLTCNANILDRLLVSGGDLRLHDVSGQTPRDYAMRHSDAKRRKQTLELIDKVQQNALRADEVLVEKAVFNKSLPLPVIELPTSLHSSLGSIEKRPSSPSNTRKSAGRVNMRSVISLENLGFGKARVVTNKRLRKPFGGIPFVSMSALVHDPQAVSYCNGPHMVMEGMMWKNLPVTVKRMHQLPPHGCSIDMLINENDYMLRVRHPNILMLMGICQTDQLHGLVLLYERISVGSLHHIIHHNHEQLPVPAVIVIFYQTCDALMYLHDCGIIHGLVTSDAIQLVSCCYAKIGNFEYATESGATNEKRKWLSYPEAAYRYMAPELLMGKNPTILSDIFGLAVTLWEVLHNQLPWADKSALEIVETQIHLRELLSVNDKAIGNEFLAGLLRAGLVLDERIRLGSFEKFRERLVEAQRLYSRQGAVSSREQYSDFFSNFLPPDASISRSPDDRSAATTKSASGTSEQLRNLAISPESKSSALRGNAVSDHQKEEITFAESGLITRNDGNVTELTGDGKTERAEDVRAPAEKRTAKTVRSAGPLISSKTKLQEMTSKRNVMQRSDESNEDLVEEDKRIAIIEPVIAPSLHLKSDPSFLTRSDRLFSTAEVTPAECGYGSERKEVPPGSLQANKADDRKALHTTSTAVVDGGDSYVEVPVGVRQSAVSLPSGRVHVMKMREVRQAFFASDSASSLNDVKRGTSAQRVDDSQPSVTCSRPQSEFSISSNSVQNGGSSVGLDDQMQQVLSSVDKLTDDEMRAFKDLLKKPLPPLPKYYMKYVRTDPATANTETSKKTSTENDEFVRDRIAYSTTAANPMQKTAKSVRTDGRSGSSYLFKDDSDRAVRLKSASSGRSNGQKSSQSNSSRFTDICATRSQHSVTNLGTDLDLSFSASSSGSNKQQQRAVRRRNVYMSQSPLVASSVEFTSAIAAQSTPVTSATPDSTIQLTKRACKPAAHYEPSMVVHLPVDVNTTPNQFFTPPVHRQTVSNHYQPMPRYDRYVTVSSAVGSVASMMDGAKDRKAIKRACPDAVTKSMPQPTNNTRYSADAVPFNQSAGGGALRQSIVSCSKQPVVCSLSRDNFVNNSAEAFSRSELMSDLLRRVMTLEQNSITSTENSDEDAELLNSESIQSQDVESSSNARDVFDDGLLINTCDNSSAVPEASKSPNSLLPNFVHDDNDVPQPQSAGDIADRSLPPYQPKLMAVSQIQENINYVSVRPWRDEFDFEPLPQRNRYSTGLSDDVIKQADEPVLEVGEQVEWKTIISVDDLCPTSDAHEVHEDELAVVSGNGTDPVCLVEVCSKESYNCKMNDVRCDFPVVTEAHWPAVNAKGAASEAKSVSLRLSCQSNDWPVVPSSVAVTENKTEGEVVESNCSESESFSSSLAKNLFGHRDNVQTDINTAISRGFDVCDDALSEQPGDLKEEKLLPAELQNFNECAAIDAQVNDMWPLPPSDVDNELLTQRNCLVTSSIAGENMCNNEDCVEKQAAKDIGSLDYSDLGAIPKAGRMKLGASEQVLPVRDLVDLDYMQRFRSDPILPWKPHENEPVPERAPAVGLMAEVVATSTKNRQLPGEERVLLHDLPPSVASPTGKPQKPYEMPEKIAKVTSTAVMLKDDIFTVVAIQTPAVTSVIQRVIDCGQPLFTVRSRGDATTAERSDSRLPRAVCSHLCKASHFQHELFNHTDEELDNESAEMVNEAIRRACADLSGQPCRHSPSSRIAAMSAV